MVKLPGHGAVEAGRGDRGGAPPGGGLGRDRGGSAWPRPRCAGRQPCRLRGLSLSASPGDRGGWGPGAIRAGRRRTPGPVRSGAARTGRDPWHSAHARPTCVVLLPTGSRLTRTVRRPFSAVGVGHPRAGNVNPGPVAVHASGPPRNGLTCPGVPRVYAGADTAPRSACNDARSPAPRRRADRPRPVRMRTGAKLALTTVSPRQAAGS